MRAGDAISPKVEGGEGMMVDECASGGRRGAPGSQVAYTDPGRISWHTREVIGHTDMCAHRGAS